MSGTRSLIETPKAQTYVLSPEFNKIRDKYQKLAAEMDRDVDLDSVSFASHESCDAVEVQQWMLTWNHLMSMITEVIPYQEKSKSWNDKRMDLVDLVAKLVRMSVSCKELKSIKSENERLKKKLESYEVKIEKQSIELRKYEELKLTGKLNGITTRMQMHIEEQNDLLNKLERDEKRRKEI